MKNKLLLDERLVSWKILLPHKPGANVLAVGLDSGSLKSLFRTWEQIDCFYLADSSPLKDKIITGEFNTTKIYFEFKEINKKYDIIVVADQSYMDKKKTALISKLLKANGVYVSMGYCDGVINRSYIKHSAFPSIKYYSALPQNAPRLFVPLGKKILRKKGLGFHTPGGFFSRIIFKAVKFANQIGVKFHLYLKPLIIAYRSKNLSGALLTDFLERLLNTKISDLIIYTGSDQPNRKITALAVSEDGQNSVVKIADTNKGRNAIRQEGDALSILNSTELFCHVPDLIIQEASWMGYTIQVQSEILLDIDKQSPVLSKQHYKFLIGLSFINRKVSEIQKTETYVNLIGKLERVSLKEQPNLFVKIIDFIQTNEFRKQKIVSHRTHGDFAPWNIKAKGKQFFVVDWEESLSDGLALTDIFHFIYRNAALVGPWKGGFDLLNQFKKSVDLFNKEAELPELNYNAILSIWLTNEYLKNPSPHIEELIDVFIKGLGK